MKTERGTTIEVVETTSIKLKLTKERKLRNEGITESWLKRDEHFVRELFETRIF